MADESVSPSESGSSAAHLERMVQSALHQVQNTETDGNAEVDLADSSEAANLARVLLSEKYSGAFPHPSVLRDLDIVVKDGAERAFRLTEKEQDHRHDCDKKLLDAEIKARDSEIKDRRLIIILVSIFLFLALCGSFASIMTDHPAGAGLAGGGAVILLGGLVGLFKKQQKGTEDESKK